MLININEMYKRDEAELYELIDCFSREQVDHLLNGDQERH